MILAAGRGERMRPLTDSSPKPLLKVAGKRLIEYHLENLARSGIKEVVINHAWLGDQFEPALGSGEQYGLRIHYSDEGKKALETAGGIIRALPYLGVEPFLIINGDIWTDYELSALTTQKHKMDQLIHLVLVNNRAHHPRGDFDIDENNFLLDRPAYTYSGIGIYSPKIFTKLKVGVQPLAPIIRQAIKQQQVTGELYNGAWEDIGTPERLIELETKLET